MKSIDIKEDIIPDLQALVELYNSGGTGMNSSTFRPSRTCFGFYGHASHNTRLLCNRSH
jgi:hypothetical protein